MKEKLIMVLLGLFCLGVGLGLGWQLGNAGLRDTANNRQISKPQKVNFSDSYSASVAQASPAVVNISSQKRVQQALSPLDWFFGGGSYAYPERVQRSLGSGVLISPDGLIITNTHVVQGADRILVNFDGRDERQARLLGADNKTDLALLKIEGAGYPYLRFADTSSLAVGDIVLAIGNPFGIGQTVTAGIISGLNRENLGITAYEDFIQTDASINPGNSGGALINTNGQLIGINTAIYSKTGGSQGIGFAVPADVVHKIAEDLRIDGQVRRPHLGIEIQNLRNLRPSPLKMLLAEQGHKDGVLIASIDPGSPAAKAQLPVGGLIESIDGQQIKTAEQVFKIIAESSVEQTMQLEVLLLGVNNAKMQSKTYTVQPEYQRE